MPITKIVSGGQTGVDRAAFDVAIEFGIEIGGFVPLGRLAEDGPIANRYHGLVETASEDVNVRTRMNVENSDGTLIISKSKLFGGSLYTFSTAQAMGKPRLVVDLKSADDLTDPISEWLNVNRISVLNIAGPRESEEPGIYDFAAALLRVILKKEIERG